jgi:hypothetical protein
MYNQQPQQMYNQQPQQMGYLLEYPTYTPIKSSFFEPSQSFAYNASSY